MVKPKFSPGDYITGPARGKLYRVLGMCRYLPHQEVCYALRENSGNEIHIVPLDEVNRKFYKLKETT